MLNWCPRKDRTEQFTGLIWRGYPMVAHGQWGKEEPWGDVIDSRVDFMHF
jgi:hypothetical protein